MRNKKNNFMCVQLLVICLLGSASCTTIKKRAANALKEKPQVIVEKNPISIQISGKEKEEEVQLYHSASCTKIFEKGQLAKEKEEIVDFKTKSVLQKILKKPLAYSYIIETTEKNGVMDLHDLVMPNLGEKINLILLPDATVYKAGNYPKESVFYLPPISLPKEPVKVGDTWYFNNTFVNSKNGMPTQIEIVSILKNLYACGTSRCAEIEISGGILIPEDVYQNMQFESDIVGRILVDIATAKIIWSEIRNHEKLSSEDSVVDISSCMESKLKSPESMEWKWAQPPACDPKTPFVASIPGN